MQNFLVYLKKDKRVLVCALLLLAGFALVIIGSIDFGTDKTGASISEEEKIEQMCSRVEGVGKCRVTVNYDGESVASIVVLCDGGNDTSVKKRLSDILVTLYDIGYNRVRIDGLF